MNDGIVQPKILKNHREDTLLAKCQATSETYDVSAARHISLS